MNQDTITAPEVEEMIANSTYTSTFDMSSAFYSIPLRKEDRRLTKFLGPDRQAYSYSCCGMGMKNSMTFLNQLTRKVFQGMEKYVLCFADDILICSNGTWQEHLQKVEEVLNRLIKANLLISPAKSLLMHPEVQYLGIVYTHGAKPQMAIPAARIKGYLDQERPKTRKGLVSFLASVNYFRKFLPYHSHVAEPLHRAICADPDPKAVIDWTPERDKAYKDILENVKENAVMQVPNPQKPFVAFSDCLLYTSDAADE